MGKFLELPLEGCLVRKTWTVFITVIQSLLMIENRRNLYFCEQILRKFLSLTTKKLAFVVERGLLPLRGNGDECKKTTHRTG